MPNDELEDLKRSVELDGDTEGDDIDPTSQEEEEGESIEELKARLQKAEEDRDNYKQGMLSHIVKKRSLDTVQRESDVSPEMPDVSEEKVLSVLYKQNEKAVMRAVVNTDSPLYLPELVDDRQFQTIVSEYLPRNIDKSSPEGIHRALRIAVAAWKADNGIADKPNNKSVNAKLQETSTDTQSGGSVEVKKPRKRILTNDTSSPKDWYK